MPKYYAQTEDGELGFDISSGPDGTVVRPLTVGTDHDLRVDFTPVHSDPTTGDGLYSLLVDNKSYQMYVERTEDGMRVVLSKHRFDVKVLTEREWRLRKVAPRQAVQTGEVVVKAPMPGMVKGVVVSGGDEVKSGQRMVVLEAMKMENDINAPRDGRVSKVHVEQGAVVEGGRPLVTLE